MRFNQYRVVWIFVFFDLPTESKKQRKAHTKFRKNLLKDGFRMFQFSIYIRHCQSQEISIVHTNRIKSFLPDAGEIGILRVTDKQFGLIDLFSGIDKEKLPKTPQQLEFF